MSMSDAHLRCEELGIDPESTDALPRLWSALSIEERREIFPFATDHEVEAPNLGPGGYVLSEPEAGEFRMWNGTSKLVFEVLARRARGEYKIRYTGGEEAFSTWRELFEASHVVDYTPGDDQTDAAAPALPVSQRMRRWADDGMPRPWPQSPGDPVRAFADEVAELERRAAPSAAAAAGRLSFPPLDTAARARVLALDAIQRVRARSLADVPPGGRKARPGERDRGAVLREAADCLARLCAVYLCGEGERNHAEARAYAFAFRLVEQSARRLAMRRLR